jgi:hypothetical protein
MSEIVRCFGNGIGLMERLNVWFRLVGGRREIGPRKDLHGESAATTIQSLFVFSDLYNCVVIVSKTAKTQPTSTLTTLKFRSTRP